MELTFWVKCFDVVKGVLLMQGPDMVSTCTFHSCGIVVRYGYMVDILTHRLLKCLLAKDGEHRFGLSSIARWQGIRGI